MSEEPTEAAAGPDDRCGGRLDRERDHSVEMLAAALRADLADLSAYAHVLTHTLAGALPAGMVAVERDRSLTDRLARRPGTVTLLQVHTHTGYLELTTQRGDLPEAHVVVTVLGTVVSRRHLTVAQWTHLLAEVLSARASESTAAREALSELLGG